MNPFIHPGRREREGQLGGANGAPAQERRRRRREERDLRARAERRARQLLAGGVSILLHSANNPSIHASTKPKKHT